MTDANNNGATDIAAPEGEVDRFCFGELQASGERGRSADAPDYCAAGR